MNGKLKLLGFIIIAIFYMQTAFGEERYKPLEIEVAKQHGHRPRKPQLRKPVMAVYANYSVEIQFEESEGYSWIEVSNMNTGVSFVEEAETDMPIFIYIEEEIGTYQIDIVTEKNHYVGYLTF